MEPVSFQSRMFAFFKFSEHGPCSLVLNEERLIVIGIFSKRIIMNFVTLLTMTLRAAKRRLGGNQSEWFENVLKYLISKYYRVFEYAFYKNIECNECENKRRRIVACATDR